MTATGGLSLCKRRFPAGGYVRQVHGRSHRRNVDNGGIALCCRKKWRQLGNIDSFRWKVIQSGHSSSMTVEIRYLWQECCLSGHQSPVSAALLPALLLRYRTYVAIDTRLKQNWVPEIQNIEACNLTHVVNWTFPGSCMMFVTFMLYQLLCHLVYMDKDILRHCQFKFIMLHSISIITVRLSCNVWYVRLIYRCYLAIYHIRQ